MLETQVIDSGIGIDENRQNNLFVPFKELKALNGIAKSKNDNLGLGLACSLTIVEYMQGDICLKQSKQGLTNVAFKIPVTVEGSVVNDLCTTFEKLIGKRRSMDKKVKSHLN